MFKHSAWQRWHTKSDHGFKERASVRLEICRSTFMMQHTNVRLKDTIHGQALTQKEVLQPVCCSVLPD